MDWLYPLSGFVVGALVGLTGMGGGSLMTPLLILLFGIHPLTRWEPICFTPRRRKRPAFRCAVARSTGEFWPPLVRWRRAGVWDQLMNALTAGYDASVQMIDTSVVRVHQHGACIAAPVGG